MARGFNDEVTKDQFRAAIQRELATGEKPVPRYAAEANLSRMDEPSKHLLYAGLGLTAIAALGSLFGFDEDWTPLALGHRRQRWLEVPSSRGRAGPWRAGGPAALARPPAGGAPELCPASIVAAVRTNGWLVYRVRAEVQSVSWRHAGRTVELLVVDLPSEVWVARDPLLREVNRLVEQYHPDLVIGDFNAPRRSWSLRRLPSGYRHAYETAGGGWGYTWPVPDPMYSLDHCLHGPRVAPGRYRPGGMGGTSDHRYQVFDFSLAAERPGPDSHWK